MCHYDCGIRQTDCAKDVQQFAIFYCSTCGQVLLYKALSNLHIVDNWYEFPFIEFWKVQYLFLYPSTMTFIVSLKRGTPAKMLFSEPLSGCICSW